MKLALYQMQMSEKEADNLEKCLKAIRQASADGADLILFPELCLHRFFPQYPDMRTRVQPVTAFDETVRRFQAACRENQIYAVPNFYLEENGKPYDASMVINAEGEIIGIQKMVHIAQAEHFYEQSYYTPSNDGFQVFDTDFGKIGVVVCFDRHYPESIRTESLMGASLILVPTANTAAEPLEMFEWEIRVQAFQNRVPIVMCNRTGAEDEMRFAGESLAVDAEGGLLKKADGEERLFLVPIDTRQGETAKKSRPYTTLRRPELYL